MYNWNITPLVGIGPITFAMTRDQIIDILGPPEFMDDPDLPLSGPIPEGVTTMEHRIFDDPPATMQPTVEYSGDAVVSVEFPFEFDTLRVGEIFIFKQPLLVTADLLMQKSRHYAVDDHGFIFLDLGISMNNDDWEVSESVNVFSKGWFDENVADGLEDGYLKVVRT